MTDLNQKLLNLIIQGKSVNDICNEMKISRKQLLNRLNSLKKDGYQFINKYYENGVVKLEINKNYKIDNNINIITNSKSKNLKIMAISDLHIGSNFSRIDCLNLIYDYCVKNNVHIIINAGDCIDGQNDKVYNPSLEEYQKQIFDLIKNHPFDKNILNFICLGNHDYDSLKKVGIDLSEIFLTNRIDLIPIGYGLGKVNIKNDTIYVIHPIANIPLESVSNQIVFKGHSHKIRLIPGNHLYYIPSLSDIKQVNSPFLPSCLEFDISFNDGYFSEAVISTLLVNDRVNKISETQVNLTLGRKLPKKNIKNEI